MANDIFELRVRQIIADKLGIPLEDVLDTCDIMDDLGADSIDALDLIMLFEEEFMIDISDADVINNRVVGDIIEYVTNKKRVPSRRDDPDFS